MQTQLHRLPNPSFYGYQDTPWQIFLRKEVPGAGLTRGRGDTQIGEPGQGGAELGTCRCSRAGLHLGADPGVKRSEGPLEILTEAPPPQVFYPKDSYSHPVQLDLLFRQVRASLPFLPPCTQQGNGHVD